jgi:CubicO group peptidase (beta-lactamase class C family)
MTEVVYWVNEFLLGHTSLRDEYMAKGYRFISLSVYGFSVQLYAAVMIAREELVTQHDYPFIASADALQQTFDDEAAKGFGPVIIAASGSASFPMFAAVFEPQNPIPLTRWGIDAATFQGMNAQALQQGGILSWAAAYGYGNDTRFAAIWMPNPGDTLWNADGLSDSADYYQGRFNAQKSQWCRPAFVTLNSNNQYLSVFVDTEVNGGWYANHNMTFDVLTTELNTAKGNGFFPACIQGAAPNVLNPLPDPTFAAIFVKGVDTVQKQFTPTGPVAEASIDNLIQQEMQAAGPVRHAALAIVHGTQLVYARGYTLAEPDWPVVQPTTCFRLASCSKTPTALAIFQLIDEGLLNTNPWDTLQDILQLKTPSGGPPSDPGFNDITIQHLLEHTSGIDGTWPNGDPEDFTDGVAIRDAFRAAGYTSAALPVSNDMTDSYIASFKLKSTPGLTQAYSSTGYYLLGRVVAKLRYPNIPNPRTIDALQYLFDPLHITRIRRAQDLVVDQLTDEARYQNHQGPGSSLALLPSQLSNSQPLVPVQYGSQQISIDEGDGGLSGAVTDIARLIAVLISQNDIPGLSLSRSTLTAMLSAGAALTAAGMGRSGYGFDALIQGPSNPPADTGGPPLSNGQFYGQKGGEWAGCQSVVQFNGDWGFVMLWGTNLTDQSWYPDYPAVMNIAKTVSWGLADLFPQFGMPSL